MVNHRQERDRSGILATFVDCEATSFSGYCTEIGFAQVCQGPPHQHGTARIQHCAGLTIRSESRLIRVDDWLDDYLKWDPAAEEVTGISRTLLLDHGRPAAEVAAWLNEELEGLPVYSDAPRYDRGWIDGVFGVAGFKRRFTIVPIERMGWRKDIGRAEFRGLCDAQFDLLHGDQKPHRAEADAISWAQVFTRARRSEKHPESIFSKLIDLFQTSLRQ